MARLVIAHNRSNNERMKPARLMPHSSEGVEVGLKLAAPPAAGRPGQLQSCCFTLALTLSRPALAQASSLVPPP
jgi:hypothetical protein